MNVNFNLKNPSAQRSPIRVVITHRGRVFRKTTGLTVLTERWKRPKKGRQWTTDKTIAAEMKKILLKLEEKLTDYSTDAEIINALNEAIDSKVSFSKSGRPSFYDCFMNRPSTYFNDKKLKEISMRRITEACGFSFDWEDIDYAFMAKVDEKMIESNYSQNYRATVISRIKATMNDGRKLKYHNNTEYQTYSVPTMTADSVYLTQSEVDRLWALELPEGSIIRKVRDLFIIGIYTAARYSDYSRLTSDMVSGNEIRFIQKKTSDSVVVPMSPRVRQVLSWYGGSAPKVGYSSFKVRLREACKMAGITDKVTLKKSRGRAMVQEIKEKWEIVTGHTARRTGATLLYMNGVPTWQCMLITGHRSESSFFKYIKVTKEENARKLASNPFFNQNP